MPRTPNQIPFRDFSPTNTGQWTHIVDRAAASPASPSLKRSETSLRQFTHTIRGTCLVSSDKPNAIYPRDLQPMEVSVADAAVLPGVAGSPRPTALSRLGSLILFPDLLTACQAHQLQT
jgi:hypothetical protein